MIPIRATVLCLAMAAAFPAAAPVGPQSQLSGAPESGIRAHVERDGRLRAAARGRGARTG